MSEWLPLIAFAGTLLSVSVGAWISFRVMHQNQRHQALLDEVKDRRALRDGKYARLVRAYESALEAAVAIDHYVGATRNASPDQVVELHTPRLESVFAAINQARARLLVQADAEPVADAFDEMFLAFTAYRVADPLEMTARWEKEKALNRSKDALRAAVLASLAPLSNPIP